MEKKVYNKYINRRGYIIRKTHLNEKELKKIQKNLLVSPYNPIKNKLIQMQKRRGVEIKNDTSEEFKIYSEILVVLVQVYARLRERFRRS